MGGMVSVLILKEGYRPLAICPGKAGQSRSLFTVGERFCLLITWNLPEDGCGKKMPGSLAFGRRMSRRQRFLQFSKRLLPILLIDDI